MILILRTIALDGDYRETEPVTFNMQNPWLRVLVPFLKTKGKQICGHDLQHPSVSWHFGTLGTPWNTLDALTTSVN